MKKNSVKESIEKIIMTLIKEYNPKKIVLFGSYSHGKPSLKSDIDLLIVKDYEKKSMVDRFVDVKTIIYDENLKIPVSPLVLTEKELNERLSMGDDFINEILSKGKLLYER